MILNITEYVRQYKKIKYKTYDMTWCNTIRYDTKQGKIGYDMMRNMKV